MNVQKKKPSIKLAQNENPEDAPSGFSALSRRAFHRLIAANFFCLTICKYNNSLYLPQQKLKLFQPSINLAPPFCCQIGEQQRKEV